MSEETTGAVTDNADEWPKKITAEDLPKHVGWYTHVWRKMSKDAAKILHIGPHPEPEEGDTDLRITYEILSGADKGKHVRSRYDSSRAIGVYDEEHLPLALLEV